MARLAGRAIAGLPCPVTTIVCAMPRHSTAGCRGRPTGPRLQHPHTKPSTTAPQQHRIARQPLASAPPPGAPTTTPMMVGAKSRRRGEASWRGHNRSACARRSRSHNRDHIAPSLVSLVTASMNYSTVLGFSLHPFMRCAGLPPLRSQCLAFLLVSRSLAVLHLPSSLSSVHNFLCYSSLCYFDRGFRVAGLFRDLKLDPARLPALLLSISR